MKKPLSPCVGLCEIDAASGFCRGCRRTLAEIAEWSRMDDDRRRAIMRALAARRPASVQGVGDGGKLVGDLRAHCGEDGDEPG